MTYEEIYNQALKELCLFPGGVEDYRPAVEMHIKQLKEPIPNGIIIWLKNGDKIIYVADSQKEEQESKTVTVKQLEKMYDKFQKKLWKEHEDVRGDDMIELGYAEQFLQELLMEFGCWDSEVEDGT